MKYRIVWLAQAVEELEAIRFYLDPIAPEASLQLAKKIYQRINELTLFPSSCPRDSMRPRYRRLAITRNYSVLYQVSEKESRIYIAHVWHNSRDKNRM